MYNVLITLPVLVLQVLFTHNLLNLVSINNDVFVWLNQYMVFVYQLYYIRSKISIAIMQHHSKQAWREPCNI